MLATQRAVLLHYTRDGQRRRGSGLRVGEHYVLTADHCADGTDHQAIVNGQQHAASVYVRSRTADIDLAVLEVRNLPGVEPLSCALVDQQVAAHLSDCTALGFPTWKDRTDGPRLAQVGGYVPTAEDATRSEAGDTPRLMPLKVTDPEARGQHVNRGALEQPGSLWAGMSGAVAVTADDVVIGVVCSHATAEGNSLTLTPLSAINSLPEDRASLFWQALAVPDPRLLPTLPLPPERPDIARYLELLEEVLDQDPWTRAAGTAGRTLSVSGIARPSTVHVVDRSVAPTGNPVFDPTQSADTWARLVVLGGPGTGKTWLARRVAVSAAQEARHAIETGRDPATVSVPIFASIADIGTENSVWSAVITAGLSTVRHRLPAPELALLRTQFTDPKGPYLLVLDGLDEAGGGFDERILGWLPETPDLDARILLTSRPGAWSHQLPLDRKDPRHLVVELSPLEYPAEVLGVVDTWLGDRPEARDRLVHVLADRPELAEASRTPLLCAMFCLLAESPDGIPSRRRELFRRLVTRLLRGEWRPRERAADYEPARRALRYLACAGAVDSPRTGLAEWPDAIAASMPVPLSEQVLAWVTNVAPPQGYDPNADPQPRRFVHRSIREYLLAEHLITLPAAEVAVAAQPHLWFDVSWEPVLPAAVAAHPNRDELLRRLVTGDDRAVTDDGLAASDGFGELRRLLVRLAAETSPDDWQNDTRDLIDRACAALRRTAVDRLLVADNGWTGAQPDDAEVRQLVTGDFPWRGPEMTTWVRRLRLRGAQRKWVLRALTGQLVTGRNEVGGYWSGIEEDAARALLALDPSPAESARALQGLSARMHHYLDQDKARAFRLLGGHMDRAELLQLVQDVRQHEAFDSMSAHIVERCARGLAELDAAQDVRELVAGQLMDEADRDHSRRPGWWVQALSRLRPTPPTAARAVAMLISNARGRDGGDRRGIMEDLEELARELDEPGATLQALIRGYGPWEHRDVALAALTTLVRRCSEEDRGEAIQVLVQRLHDSEGWDTYYWSIHLTALTPAGEPDPAAADALIAKILETAIEESYYLLISLEQVVASDAQRCTVLSFLQDQLRRAAVPGLRLAICRRARPFLTAAFDHSEFICAAIAAAGQPDTSLSELREAVRELPLSKELRARALDALQGGLATAAVSDLWGVVWAVQDLAPERRADEQEKLVRTLITRLERETSRPESLLGMLAGLDALDDSDVARIGARALLGKPVSDWDISSLTRLLPRMTLRETDRREIMAAMVGQLRERPSPFLYAEDVHLVEELDLEGEQENAVTQLLIERLGHADDLHAGRVDGMEQHELLSLLTQRALDPSERERVMEACVTMLAWEPHAAWWLFPALSSLDPSASEKRTLLAAAVEGVGQRALGVPTGLPARLRELTSPGPQERLALVEAFRAARRRQQERETFVSYRPGTPDRELYSYCIDIGRSPLEAFQDVAPVQPDLVEPADEDAFRELAAATRHGSSYQEWSQALPAWAALDESLYDVT